MKTRQGFVSNSSSSSFCCMTTREISEKADAKLTQEQRDVLEDVMQSWKLGNMTFVGYDESSSNGGESYVGGQEYTEEIDDAVNSWRVAVEQVGGKNPIIKVDIEM